MFGLIKKNTAIKALQPLIQQVKVLQAYNNRNNLSYTIYGYANQTEQVAAYATIGDLYTIVRKLYQTAAQIPIYEYRITNKKAYGKYKILEKKAREHPSNKAIYELKQLQEEALELAGSGSPLQDLLDKPNGWQSKAEFYQLTFLFKLLTGNYYIKKELLNAAANEGKVYEMYNLPANFTYPVATNDIPRRVGGYKFNLYNQTNFFETEEIIHGKYANPVFDFSGNELIGLSPLQAGAKTLTTISNEADYQNQSLKNAGAGGVMIAKDATDSNIESYGEMKEDVLRELGSAYDGSTNRNINKLGFLGGNWDYLKIFIDPANMQLLEQAKQTFKQLCNIYGMDAKLFNNDDGAKYDNYDVALREMYTNAALPLVSALCDDFNLGLAPHFGEGSVVGFDISDIPALQENQETVIKRFAEAPAFRVNDLYESVGFGRIAGPDGDRVLVKSGYTPMEDLFSMPGNIPDDYNA